MLSSVDVPGLRAAASSAMKAEKWVVAANYWRALIASDIQSHEYFGNFGLCLHRSGKISAALESLKASADLGTSNIKILRHYKTILESRSEAAAFFKCLPPYYANFSNMNNVSKLYLVLAPNKVASQTVHQLILNAVGDNANTEVFHSHFLRTVKQACLGELTASVLQEKIAALCVKYVDLLCLIEAGIPAEIVTVTRDPVARIYSGFAHKQSKFIVSRFNGESFDDAAYLTSRFNRFSERMLEDITSWYATELGYTLGLDILTCQRAETGLWHASNGLRNLTVVRMEDLDDLWDALCTAIGLDRDQKKFSKNTAESRLPIHVYEAFKRQVRMNSGLVDQLYTLKETTFFYSDEEIKALRSKWEKTWGVTEA